jgi:hypothetical protein
MSTCRRTSCPVVIPTGLPGTSVTGPAGGNGTNGTNGTDGAALLYDSGVTPASISVINGTVDIDSYTLPADTASIGDIFVCELLFSIPSGKNKVVNFVLDNGSTSMSPEILSDSNIDTIIVPSNPDATDEWYKCRVMITFTAVDAQTIIKEWLILGLPDGNTYSYIPIADNADSTADIEMKFEVVSNEAYTLHLEYMTVIHYKKIVVV